MVEKKRACSADSLFFFNLAYILGTPKQMYMHGFFFGGGGVRPAEEEGRPIPMNQKIITKQPYLHR